MARSFGTIRRQNLAREALSEVPVRLGSTEARAFADDLPTLVRENRA
jgi:hypothetical protein